MIAKNLSSKPPEKFLDKFAYYTHKYGSVHALTSYLGRYNSTFWQYIGSQVTRGYIERWLENQKLHILNLGSGSNCLDDCLNVDIDPRSDAYVDITRPLPFPNNSIDCIFCEEVIEHIPFNTGHDFLKECLRILKSEGTLRISTPDLGYFALQTLTSQNFCHDINEIFYGHGHCYLYTQVALQSCCREIGFINLKPSSYRDRNSKLGYLDSHADRFHHLPEISQYLEMQKPS